MPRRTIGACLVAAVCSFLRLLRPAKLFNESLFMICVLVALWLAMSHVLEKRERERRAEWDQYISGRVAQYRTDLKSSSWSVERERYTLVYPSPFHDLLQPEVVEKEIIDGIEAIERIAGKFRRKPFVVIGMNGKKELRRENGTFNQTTAVSYVFFAALGGIAAPGEKHRYHTIAHELMHHRVEELRMELGVRIPRYLDEGLAHSVERSRLMTWGSPHWPEDVTITREKLLREDERLSDRDFEKDQELRRAGWAVAHFVLEHRKMPLRNMLLLAERDLPEPREALAEIRRAELEKQKNGSAAERAAVDAAANAEASRLAYMLDLEVPKAFRLILARGPSQGAAPQPELMPSTPAPPVLLANFVGYSKTGSLATLGEKRSVGPEEFGKIWPVVVNKLYGKYLVHEGYHRWPRTPWSMDLQAAALLKRLGPLLPTDVLLDRCGPELEERASATGWAVCYALWRRDGRTWNEIESAPLEPAEVGRLVTWTLNDLEADPNALRLAASNLGREILAGGARRPESVLQGVLSEVVRLRRP